MHKKMKEKRFKLITSRTKRYTNGHGIETIDTLFVCSFAFFFYFSNIIIKYKRREKRETKQVTTDDNNVKNEEKIELHQIYIMIVGWACD